MSHWAFVAAAYGVTVSLNAALLLWAWRSMRRAESAADQHKRR